MPLAWHLGTWLLYFLIQVNYLIALHSTYVALGNPVVRDENLIWIACLSGEMTFHCVEEDDSGTLTMQLVGGAFTYYLIMVLRTAPLEPQERPLSSQEVHISQVRPRISQIPSILVHPPSDLQIVPPGIPFCIPCPCCQYSLERGEYCTSHCAEGTYNSPMLRFQSPT